MYRSLQMGRSIAAILVTLFHLGKVMALEKYFGIKEFDYKGDPSTRLRAGRSLSGAEANK